MQIHLKAVAVATTFIALAGCGGGGGGNPPVTDISIGSLIRGTIDSATDVDAFRLPISQEGTLTIATTGSANPSIRALDATGTEIPGRRGSYIVDITDAVLAKGDHIIIEFYGGTVGQSYSGMMSFDARDADGGSSTEPADPPMTTPDAGQLLASGNILTARHVAALYVGNTPEDGGPIAPRLINANFSITRNARGEYAVSFADDSHTFVTDQLTPTGGQYNGGTGTRGPGCPADPIESRLCGGFIWFELESPDLFDALNSGHSQGDHYIAFAAERSGFTNLDDADVFAYAIAGQPTPNFNTLTDATATYSGNARLTLHPLNFEREEIEYESQGVTLTANFANSTVSGEIRNFMSDSADGFSLTMPETAFGTRGFSGNFVTVPHNGSDQLTVSYGGSFYGPGAENAAGTMRATGTVDGIPVTGPGFFGTKR